MKERRKSKALRNDDNRRSKKRIYTELDVSAFINGQEYFTKMRNISGNGMQIIESFDIEMEPKQDCQVVIKDEDTTINLDAYVVWKDFGLIGLCFEKQNQKNSEKNKQIIPEIFNGFPDC